jgi:hypothetical protein
VGLSTLLQTAVISAGVQLRCKCAITLLAETFGMVVSSFLELILKLVVCILLRVLGQVRGFRHTTETCSGY